MLSFILALVSSKSLIVPFLAIIAVLVQFFGYGYGFLKSSIIISFSKKEIEQQFPTLFFKVNKNDI